jgi:hypothetical protein
MSDGRIHYSTLKLMGTSPLAYKAAAKHDAAHLRRGTAVHALTYMNRNIAVYDGVRNGKAWETFKAENAGSVLVSRREYTEASDMAMAVHCSATVARMGLLTPKARVVETEILWDFNGAPFSSTPDLHCPDFCVDLKTTKCAKPGVFERDIMKYSYHVQAALYRRAIEQRYGYLPKHSYIVAVESKAPHDVVVYRITPKLLELGERQACLWLEELRNCEASDCWPGYSNAVVDVDVPEWMIDEDEEEDEEAA